MHRFELKMIFWKVMFETAYESNKALYYGRYAEEDFGEILKLEELSPGLHIIKLMELEDILNGWFED